MMCVMYGSMPRVTSTAREHLMQAALLIFFPVLRRCILNDGLEDDATMLL